MQIMHEGETLNTDTAAEMFSFGYKDRVHLTESWHSQTIYLSESGSGVWFTHLKASQTKCHMDAGEYDDLKIAAISEREAMDCMYAFHPFSFDLHKKVFHTAILERKNNEKA